MERSTASYQAGAQTPSLSRRPAGQPDAFGVRLEDPFHVTETGAAWFTEPQASLEEPFPPTNQVRT